ncbi:Sodium/hydrogen exchanger family-domain-containing protein [Daldinia caldariorum]|uniref:Sodium/hydrogen exchanger family-domain-containing protein n=1 Tax=Daldinia caldariorum TaxID=326644 RepID=UPI002008CBEF|nr:Sodium/hydrogen exchanger family-domain-containing protein [Daldinia caldariorum]KAI1472241.1 Sodium/hydrogen exchanger family-domain-containing protein [Daldinia caldariorum]
MASTTANVTTTLLSTVTAAATPPPAPTAGPPPQGGILEGVLPNTYITSNPIQLFIIQAGIIIILCRLLHYPLSYCGQPRVIAEVIGGIILGPSVLARIPGFKNAIFPTESMPVLNNAANLGLILFLFLVGLEVDLSMFTSNWKVALSVGLAGMLLPFGFGCAIAWGLYNQFHNDGNTVEISFGIYALFIGTALAITAFPVLCRILSELNMLSTPVGVTVLAAGVGNDVVGWILLALCVALVNNGSGLTALWVLLVAIGWILFLVFAVKPVFHWALRKTGSIQNGPTQGMIAVTILLVLTSAWFTSIIGIHAIFGAFLIGLICPHEGGFTIHVTEKIEDLVTVLFLPLYFALSGLSTDLGLLNDGITWGYVFGVIVVAFCGKIMGGTLAAKAMKLVWRESFSIGVLMSCKGLVELIVLNIGLQAKILSQKTFTIFVVMALVTTVSTSPLTRWLYPPWYQRKLEQWKRGEIDWDGNPLEHRNSSQDNYVSQLQEFRIRRLLVNLRLDSLPSLFTFISLLGDEKVTPSSEEASKSEAGDDTIDAPTPITRRRPLEVHALRILELTERTSSVMKVAKSDEYSRRDPVVNAFRTFARLHDVAVSGSVVITPEDSYAQTIVTQASDRESDFVLIPWGETGSNKEDQSIPFRISPEDRFSEKAHQDFVQATLANAVCSTGVFIGNESSEFASLDRPAPPRTISGVSIRSNKESALPPIADKSLHVFFPYLGGADDRYALHFVLHLAKNPLISVTVAHLDFVEGEDEIAPVKEGHLEPDSPTSISKNTIDTEMTAQDTSLLAALQSNISPELASRVTFTEVSVTAGSAVKQATELARETVGKNLHNAGDIVVVGRRHPILPATVRTLDQSSTVYDMQKTIGVFGQAMAMSDIKAGVLVVQAVDSGIAQ